MSRRITFGAHRQAGAAAIELALVMTFVLIPAVIAVTVAGQAIYTYDQLAKQARAAARFLAQRPDPTPADGSNPVEQAISIARCGRLSCGPNDAVLPALKATHILIETPAAYRNATVNPALAHIATGAGALHLVTVTISPVNSPYRFVPWIGGATLPDVASFDLRPISAAMPWN